MLRGQVGRSQMHSGRFSFPAGSTLLGGGAVPWIEDSRMQERIRI